MAAVFLGSFALWVVVPFGCLWIASNVSDNATTVMLTALVVTPLAMLACGLGLSMLYAAYLRAADAQPPPGRRAWLGSLSGDSRSARARRPVLDVSLTFSAITAMVLLLVWFLFLAERPIPLP